MFINFSYELQKVLDGSKKEKKNLKHSYIGTEHFFLSLLSFKNDISILLNNYGVDYEIFKNRIIKTIGYGKDNSDLFILTPLFKKILENSIYNALDNKNEELDLASLFIEIISFGEGVAYRILCDLDVDLDSLIDLVEKSKNVSSIHFLNKYGEDLTSKDFSSNKVVGREKEIKRITEILLRKNKSNPLLIGDAGVGKTAIVEELSRRIVSKEVPFKLHNKKIYSISMANLVSGTKYRGEFEEKLLNIVKEIKDNKNIILFIDEVHTLVGAGGAEGAIDASNILKPFLARGEINVIGATTNEEYKKYIESDKALVRRFQNVYVKEPDFDETVTILDKIKNNYERYHNVIIKDNTIKYIVNISKKYISNLKEPDRSIDILDDACSFATSICSKNEEENIILNKKLIDIKNKKELFLSSNNYDKALELRKRERDIESKINKNNMYLFSLNDKKVVDKDIIRSIISLKYNAVVNTLNVIKKVLLEQKNKLKDSFTNNFDNLDSIINLIIPIFDEKVTINKPVSIILKGSYLTDKKKLALSIANNLFNSNYIYFDLADYKDDFSIRNILDTNNIKNKRSCFNVLNTNPQNVVIIDHLEELDYRLFDFLKQVITSGYIEDNNGYRIYFNNSLIIFIDNTFNSNLGFIEGSSNKNNFLYKYVSQVININSFNKDRVLS